MIAGRRTSYALAADPITAGCSAEDARCVSRSWGRVIGAHMSGPAPGSRTVSG